MDLDVYPLPRVNRGDRSRVLRWILVALALAVGSGLAVTLSNVARDGGLSALTDAPSWGIPGVLVLVLGLVLYGILGLGPGADQVSFGQDRFEFASKGGKRKAFLWSGSPGKITLWTLQNPDGVSYWISTGIPFQTPVSEEAYARILREAEARGYTAEERSQPAGAGMRQTVTRLNRPR